jgi:hypothetical protein
MTRVLSALLLVAAFGLGLLAGPHPCGAPHAERESAQASCHEAETSPAGQQVRADAQQEEDGSGCGTFCRHACHMTAIAEAAPVAFAISPVSESLAEPSGSGLPLFGHPIDHIPLA